MYFTRMNWKLALWLAFMTALICFGCGGMGAPPPLPLGDSLNGVEPHDIYRAIELAMTSADGVEAGILLREGAATGNQEYVFWAEHGGEMRMVHSFYSQSAVDSGMDITIDGVVVDRKVGSSWLKRLGRQGFASITADYVVQYYHLFKAYSATIIQNTTQIWPSVNVVPMHMFEENYVDEKLTPMDT